MKIAITGSSGLIGTALRERLGSSGHDVVRITRDERGVLDVAGLTGADAVIHLAGEGIGERRWSDEQKRRIRTSRTEGTDRIARAIAALDRPPSVLLSGSAIGFYGDTGDRVADETAPAGTGFVSSVVQDWEAAAAPSTEAGIRTVFLRSGIVLSPNGGALARQLPFFRFGLGGRFGSGRQMQSWISLTDEVRAIEWLLDHDVEGPVNLTAPNPVTNGEFTKILGKQLHRPTTITPMFGPRLLFGRELADSLLLTSQHIVPKVLIDQGFTFTHPTLDVALRDLLGSAS